MARIPRAGTGQEVYVFPTVPAGPTEVSEIEGLEADEAIPDSGNSSDVIPSVSGDISLDSTSLLPIEIQIKGTKTLRLGVPGVINLIYDVLRGRSDANINDLVNAVAQNLDVVRQRPTATFAIKYTGDDNYRGVRVDFQPWPSGTGAIANEAGYSVDDDVPSPPGVCEDRDGRMLVFAAMKETASGKHKLVAFRYDQETDGAAGGFTQTADTSDTVADQDGSVSFIEDLAAYTDDEALGSADPMVGVQVAAVFHSENVYVIVAFRNTVGDVRSRFLVFLYQPSSASKFFLVSGPTFFAGSSTSKPKILDGGIAAISMGGQAVVAVGLRWEPYGGADHERSIYVQSTSDFKDLGGAGHSFSSISDVRLVGGDFTFINDVHFYDDENGWAAARDGRIFRSIDGGLNWVEQSVPISVTLSSIKAVSLQGGQYTVWACGDKGTVLKTVDSGSTWEIVSTQAADTPAAGDFVGGTQRTVDAFGDQYLTSIDSAASGNIICVAGLGNTIAFSSNATLDDSAWDNICPPDTDSSFYAMKIWKTASPYALTAAGRVTRKTPADKKSYALLRIQGLTPGDLGSRNYSYQEPGGAFGTAMFHRSGDLYAAVGSSVLTQAAGADTWTSKPGPSLGASSITSLWVDASGGLIYLTTNLGYIYVSNDGGDSWAGRRPDRGGLSSVTSPGADGERIVLGGSSGIWYQDLLSDGTTYPDMLVLDDGNLLLVGANLGRGVIQAWRSIGRDPTRLDRISGISLEETDGVAFAPTADLSDIPATALRPSVLKSSAGEIIITAGSGTADADERPTGGAVCLDGRGERWYDRDSRDILLELGMMPEPESGPTTDMINQTRKTVAYGNLRLFSFVLGDDATLYALTARNWSASVASPMPIVPNAPAWLGIDGLQISFPSLEIPANDKWTLGTRSRFAGAHVVHYSPRVYYRGGAETRDDYNTKVPIILTWDREHADVRAVMSNGKLFHVNSCALFGSNIQFASWRISLPSYTGDTFPTDPADYIQFDMSAEIETRVLSVKAGGGGAVQDNVLIFSGTGWTPHQFRPGVRTYYVGLLGVAVFKILDNTANALIIDHDPDVDGYAPSGLLPNYPVTIFSDRMVSLGIGGTTGTGIAPDLAGTEYEFGRWLQLYVPPQPTHEGYRRVGNVVFGSAIPIEARRPEGTLRRDRYEEGWRWAPTAEIREQQSIGSIKSIEQIGRTVQQWQFRYPVAEYWDRDMTLSPMVQELRRPFVIMFDSDDPLRSLEWVRLTSNLPTVVHQGADFYGYDLEIEEVP